MARYHINPETGNPNECSAQQGNCPFGSDEAHYPSKVEARIQAEAMLDKKYEWKAIRKVFDEKGEEIARSHYATLDNKLFEARDALQKLKDIDKEEVPDYATTIEYELQRKPREWEPVETFKIEAESKVKFDDELPAIKEAREKMYDGSKNEKTYLKVDQRSMASRAQKMTLEELQEAKETAAWAGNDHLVAVIDLEFKNRQHL
jgi:hypothetical protein